jgi:hypothetical protein
MVFLLCRLYILIKSNLIIALKKWLVTQTGNRTENNVHDVLMQGDVYSREGKVSYLIQGIFR